MWQITLNGPRYFNTTFVLPAGVTSLGREEDNDIVLTGNSVSRHHVQLDVRGSELFAKDLGSRNGSQINGRKLEGTALLRPGDTLSLGENQITVREPARVENVLAESVDPKSGGLRRSVDRGGAPSIALSRQVGESAVLAEVEDELRGPSRLAAPGVRLSAEARSLILLFEAADRVGGAQALQELIDGALAWAKDHLRLSSAVVLLKHPSGTMVPVSVYHHEELAQGEVPVSDTVVLAALQRNAAIAVRQPEGLKSSSRRGGPTVDAGDTVLCAPLGDVGKLTGVLYFNRVGGTDAELGFQLDVANALAHAIGLAVRQFQREDHAQKQERLRKALERFHGPNLAHQARGKGAYVEGRATHLEERTITVLLADMSEFLTLTRVASSEKIVSLLSEFYDRTSGVIFSFEGTVDKFIGESVLALFGAPNSQGDDALRALRCALEIRANWDTAMKRRPSDERCQLHIGLATGTALVGTVGSEVRVDYTALGEPVSIAQWLVATANPGQVLATEATLEAAGSRFDTIAQKDKVMKKLRRKVAFYDVLLEDKSQITVTGERPTRTKQARR